MYGKNEWLEKSGKRENSDWMGLINSQRERSNKFTIEKKYINWYIDVVE